MWYFKVQESSSILSQACDWHALISLYDIISYDNLCTSFSENTKNRNSLKTMSNRSTEKKFGVS